MLDSLAHPYVRSHPPGPHSAEQLIHQQHLKSNAPIPEKTLGTIRDDSTLNMGTMIQYHLQEDAIVKSDHTTIGAGCTLDTKAFVHYRVTMGDSSVLAPDSVLMKGEEIPPGSSW
jgi:non-ribosomal peptide synthetase-like protein